MISETAMFFGSWNCIQSRSSRKRRIFSCIFLISLIRSFSLLKAWVQVLHYNIPACQSFSSTPGLAPLPVFLFRFFFHLAAMQNPSGGLFRRGTARRAPTNSGEFDVAIYNIKIRLPLHICSATRFMTSRTMSSFCAGSLSAISNARATRALSLSFTRPVASSRHPFSLR